MFCDERIFVWGFFAKYLCRALSLIHAGLFRQIKSGKKPFKPTQGGKKSSLICVGFFCQVFAKSSFCLFTNTWHKSPPQIFSRLQREISYGKTFV